MSKSKENGNGNNERGLQLMQCKEHLLFEDEERRKLEETPPLSQRTGFREKDWVGVGKSIALRHV